MEIGTLSELMLLYRANQELFTDNKKHTKKSTVITRIFQSIKDRIQNISKIEMDIPSTFRGDIFSQFDRTTRTADHLRPSIFSTMESQDRSGMIWLREAVQNARDAMIAT